jgi:GTP-binding protein
MLIDEVAITVAAGSGGRGAVAFNKNMRSLGPAGGSGGNGGNVMFQAVSDLSALRQFRFKKELRAEDGENGKRQFNDGKTGKDLVLKVPVGTVITNLGNQARAELTTVGETILVAKGGHGGKGNFLFRSPRNPSPERFQEGLPGEEFPIQLELKLIADVGLIGLPNAGKSSLLNELTRANAKVGNYAFTTLEPNLGTFYSLILADIPGLIEGAASGKGLGDKFLRHIERTTTLFHLIAADSTSPENDYDIIRNELESYNPELLLKKEYVFLTKSDSVSKEELSKKIKLLEKHSLTVLPISIHDPESLEAVKAILQKILALKEQ